MASACFLTREKMPGRGVGVFLPDLPGRKSLKQQHFESVLDDGSFFFPFLHEEGFIRVVQKVVQQMVRGEQVVRNVGTCVDIRVHA